MLHNPHQLIGFVADLRRGLTQLRNVFLFHIVPSLLCFQWRQNLKEVFTFGLLHRLLQFLEALQGVAQGAIHAGKLLFCNDCSCMPVRLF